MAIRDLDRMIIASEVITNSIQENAAQNPWARWDVSYASFQKSYTDAVQWSSSHTEKLQQLRSLEDKITELSKEATKTREILATLTSAEANYFRHEKSGWTLKLNETTLLAESAPLWLNDLAV